MKKFLDEAMLTYLNKDGELNIAVDINRKSDSIVQQRISELLNDNSLPSGCVQFVDLNKLNELKALNATLEDGDEDKHSDNQKFVIKYFTEAVRLNASDIHFTITENSTVVEMRINGNLYEQDVISREKGMAYVKTIIFSMCDIAEPSFQENKRQDARLAEKFVKKTGLYAARYSHIPTADGLYVVMRTIANDSHKVRTLEELGFLSEHVKLLDAIQRRPEGMLILSGPTGSGKSTTLRTINAAYIERTKGLKRLVTIEDPPEGKIAGAVQTPVKSTWNDSMSAMMRLDPDAILNGEVRDFESAIAAINAALTGHFMSTTVHANDPVGILERLVIMGVNKELLADAGLIIGLVSQRLAQTLCDECKIPWHVKKKELDEKTIDYLESVLKIKGESILEKTYFHNHSGCEHCMQSVGDKRMGGIKGRTVISEIIIPTAEFMRIYRTQGAGEARNYWRNEMGGITRVTHALRKIEEGVLDPLTADSICPLDEDSLIYRLSVVAA